MNDHLIIFCAGQGRIKNFPILFSDSRLPILLLHLQLFYATSLLLYFSNGYTLIKVWIANMLLNFNPTNVGRNRSQNRQIHPKVVFRPIDRLTRKSIYGGRRSLFILFRTGSESYKKREKVDGYENVRQQGEERAESRLESVSSFVVDSNRRSIYVLI